MKNERIGWIRNFRLLESYGYPGDLPVIRGSARSALEEIDASEIGMLSIKKLMETVDTYIQQPQSNLENPFLLSVEGSLVVRGRGTVVTGKVEHGQLNVMMNWN